MANYETIHLEKGYALNNLEVKTDREFNEILKDIVEKLLNHPLSEPFSYELNEETLGDLYDQYMEMVPNPIDLDTIQKKVLRNGYDNFINFNNDINLMFRNCKTFNEKNSKLYLQGINLEDYYKLIISPIKKNRLINKNFDPSVNKNKISINLNDNNSAINEQSEKKKASFTNEINNETDLNNLNVENNTKFHIPFDISDNDSNSAELLNKKEMLKKGGNKGKKGKNNKNKKNKNNNSSLNNTNEGINLDEDKEI